MEILGALSQEQNHTPPLLNLMKNILLSILISTLTGCASGSAAKLAKELAKDPNAVGFSISLITPWGQQQVSFARASTNSASASAGTVSINPK